jgi:hypothetical protein
MIAVIFRLGNVDFGAFRAWRDANLQAWQALQARVFALGKFRLAPFPTNRKDVMWVNSWVPGRCFSSDAPANNLTNLIPHCIATGQAAGSAAALALAARVSVRHVDVRRLQRSLRGQGVPLPGAASA